MSQRGSLLYRAEQGEARRPHGPVEPSTTPAQPLSLEAFRGIRRTALLSPAGPQAREREQSGCLGAVWDWQWRNAVTGITLRLLWGWKLQKILCETSVGKDPKKHVFVCLVRARHWCGGLFGEAPFPNHLYSTVHSLIFGTKNCGIVRNRRARKGSSLGALGWPHRWPF